MRSGGIHVLRSLEPRLSVSVCSCACLYMCVLAADPSLPAIYVHQLMKHNYVYLSVSFPASVVELSLSVYVCMHVHMCVDCRRLSPSTSTYMSFFLFPFQPQKWSCTSASYPRLCDPTPPPPLTTPTSHGFRVSSPVCGTLHGTSAFLGCACGAATSILS